jgi:transcriptional regulator with XRE-family HTH domain
LTHRGAAITECTTQESEPMPPNTAPTSPLTARRRLGDELRLLRDRSGMTADEVGRHLGCTNSKISRMENGKRAVGKQDFDLLMELFDVEGEKLEELTALMVRGRQRLPPWWQAYNDVISANYAEFLAYEADARLCYEYQPVFVPALLQTPDYARAVTAVGFAALGPDQVDALVEVRMRRQERLREETPLVAEYVVTEAALRFQIGGAQTMRAQLHQLHETAARPNVSFRVLPFAAGENGIINAGYTLFGSDRDTDAEVSFTEAADGVSFRDDPLTVRRLQRLLRNLSKSALSPEDSLALVERIEKELS